MIVIDSEFQSLIPPLSDDEYDRLEKSILAEGLREPIITWNGTIIDGHNRYNICDEHGIPFTQVEHEFPSRDAAKIWIIENQFGRRNLSPYDRSVLALQLEPLYAAEAKRRALDGNSRGGKSSQKSDATSDDSEEGGKSYHLRTDEQLAKLAGTSRDTIRKVKTIEQAAEAGNPVAVQVRDELRSGEKKSIHGAYVAVVGKPKPRKPEDTVTEDGRRICAMCGEPINEGEANPKRPTVHKKCEQEYQRDWENSKENADHDLRNNVAVYTIDSLKAELLASAESMKAALKESIAINESMGVQLTSKQKKDLSASVAHVIRVINKM